MPAACYAREGVEAGDVEGAVSLPHELTDNLSLSRRQKDSSQETISLELEVGSRLEK